jgi:hypothetical protein
MKTILLIASTLLAGVIAVPYAAAQITVAAAAQPIYQHPRAP